MRIKKHENGNEYLLTEDGIWVRNFTNKVTPIDINALTDRNECGKMVNNEINNGRLDIAELDTSMISYENAIIVSDGYNFAQKHLLLKSIPTNVLIIAVNRALRKWRINRKIDYFIVNNPYSECMLQMPEKYFPKCVASSKTYYPFLEAYDKSDGIIYKYTAIQEKHYAPMHSRSICRIDDYRNPLCAAIGLCHLFDVKKLMLFCCDDSFATERPGAEQLPNGLWIYPQQWMSHRIIEAMFHWYGQGKTSLGNCSSGPEYKAAPYVKEDSILDFFS